MKPSLPVTGLDGALRADGDEAGIPGAALNGLAPLGNARKEGPLPLRLHLSRGQLGIELSTAQKLPGAEVLELGFELEAFDRPCDLSRGVKQFRHRRGQLARLRLRLVLTELAGRWVKILGNDFLPLDTESETQLPERARELKCRLRALRHEEATSVGSTAGGRSRAFDSVLAVVFSRGSATLAFDLVLGSGLEPKLYLDAARGLGLPLPPAQLAYLAVDAVLFHWAQVAPAPIRKGRSLSLLPLGRLLSLLVLPRLGCRLPKVGKMVLSGVESRNSESELLFELGTEGVSAGPRGLRLTGLAQALEAADTELASGRTEEARRLALELLDEYPDCAEALELLASVDVFHGQRDETARLFLAELSSLRRPSRGGRLAALCLEFTLLERRGELAIRAQELETWAEREPELLLSAQLLFRLAERETSPVARLALLERAARLAPAHWLLRFRQIEAELELGQLAAAKLQLAELSGRLESERELLEFERLCGQLLRQKGYSELALEWLRKALCRAPDERSLQLATGLALVDARQFSRAAELLELSLSEQEEGALSDEDRDQALYQLALLWAEELGEPERGHYFVQKIGSRSAWGQKARLLELELARSKGPRLGEQALSRLVEALELGWLKASLSLPELLGFIQKQKNAGHLELSQKLAQAVLESGELSAGPEQEALLTIVRESLPGASPLR